MVYRIDNRPKKHRGRNIGLAIIIPLIIIGAYFGYENQNDLNQALNYMIITTIPNLTPAQRIIVEPVDWNFIALQIHDLVNKERETNHISDLTWDDKIANIAMIHSKDMAVNNYMGHIDLQGNNAATRLQNANVCNGYSGENIEILYGYASPQIPQNTFDDWMNDEGHKANLLGLGYTREGIGIFSNNTNTYVTEDFC